ncbi:hypothetical protein [Sporisorium scitamineum]|uniref:Uncharacterized protein n=1 Tax=Sporisorium scitamineum TaxID=49012 RepID=A0A0F7S1Q2_9BASI|nr:hypothetical protein [Sporisorium scitamineum]
MAKEVGTGSPHCRQWRARDPKGRRSSWEALEATMDDINAHLEGKAA